MTVSTLTNSITYTGNGATTSFPVPFKVLDEDHLIVRRRLASTGAIDYTYIGTDYSYSGIGADSGTLTLNGTALTSTYKLEIERRVPYVQELDIVNAGGFYPETVEEQLDLMTMAIQQIDAVTDRAVLFPFGTAVPEDWEDIIELFKGDKGANGSGNIVGLMPEDFGAAGDGVTNDTAAFALLAAEINAMGGGVIELTPGATYMVGGQDPDLTPSVYTYVPHRVMDFTGLTKGLVIKGNGAKIKCRPGLKYGGFTTDGVPTVVATANTAAAPYNSMIQVLDSTGSIHIEDLELDGNLNNHEVGGPYGDTGIQIGSLGLLIRDCTGPLKIANIHTHHHGTDGWQLDLDGDAVDSPDNHGTFVSVKSEFNGRNNCSIVGGRGLTFIECGFNYSGRLTRNATTAGPVSSAPKAGLDIEPEGGKKVRNLRFIRCEFSNNSGVGMVSDNGDAADVIFDQCGFKGTTTYCIWPQMPRFKFNDCGFVGAMVHLYGGTDPALATQFDGGFSSNDVTLSPTGTVYGVGSGDKLVDGGTAGVQFRNFKWQHTLGTTSSNSSLDLMEMDNVTVESTHASGTLLMYGRYRGACRFIRPVSVTAGYPGAPSSPSGHAEDPFYVITGGVSVRHPATLDPRNGKPVYRANAAWTPGLIADGDSVEKDLATTAVTFDGVSTNLALGDFVDRCGFDQDLAGCLISGAVTAAGQMTVTIANHTGAGVTLGAGTVYAVGCKN